MKSVGITGHQGLDPATAALVAEAIEKELAARGAIRGFSSLAEGADQIFAKVVLKQGGTLTAVIPSSGYESSFKSRNALQGFLELKGSASEVIELPSTQPSEEAYWAAGQKVVDLADEILAVWDGEKSGGLGGTADVVAYARRQDVPVTRVWPTGSARG